MVYLMTGKTISNHLGLRLCKVCGGKGSLNEMINNGSVCEQPLASPGSANDSVIARRKTFTKKYVYKHGKSTHV